MIHAASLCATSPPPMANDDARQAAMAVEFQQKLNATVAVAVKKKYDASRAQILAATVLLEEEQRAAAVLAEEDRATEALIEPLPMLTPAPTGRATPSDDDYEAAVIANIHVEAIGVQNIHSLITVSLDLSTHYARWRDNIMPTLERYSLFVHVLLDIT
jgi:hypothetical protein